MLGTLLLNPSSFHMDVIYSYTLNIDTVDLNYTSEYLVENMWDVLFSCR